MLQLSKRFLFFTGEKQLLHKYKFGKHLALSETPSHTLSFLNAMTIAQILQGKCEHAYF